MKGRKRKGKEGKGREERREGKFGESKGRERKVKEGKGIKKRGRGHLLTLQYIVRIWEGRVEKTETLSQYSWEGGPAAVSLSLVWEGGRE